MDQLKNNIKNKLDKIHYQIDNINDDNVLILMDIDDILEEIDNLIYNKDIKYIKLNEEIKKRINENVYFEKMFKDLSPFFLIYNLLNNISNKNIIKNNV